MELLIAILMYLGVHATPDMMNDADFCAANQQEINQAQDMANSGQYQERDGIVIGGGTYPLK